MSTMYDLGEKHSTGMAEPAPDKKEKICYPSISLTEKQLPDLVGKTVGDKVTITLEVEITRVSKGDDWMTEDKEVVTRFDLEAHSGAVVGGNKPKSNNQMVDDEGLPTKSDSNPFGEAVSVDSEEED